MGNQLVRQKQDGAARTWGKMRGVANLGPLSPLLRPLLDSWRVKGGLKETVQTQSGSINTFLGQTSVQSQK